MKEIIDRILEGKFEYESGGLAFSVSRIEITLLPGEDYEGSFTITGKTDRATEGFLYSSDARMECLTKQFSGSGEEIGYLFHGKGLEEGDVLKGEISVVSNQGEYEIPFVVMVSYPVMSTSIGSVKNLFHFANLAKSSWEEAVRLFYSSGFENIFQGNDKKYLDLYRGLSRYYGNEGNVEEFLIAIHKKQKIHYIIDEDKIELDASEEGDRHQVLLTKNGWGYTRLYVEAAGDFLTPDKEQLNEDDFLGNRCNYYYYVNREKLHKGINYGSLRFYNSFVEIILPIEVRKADEAYEMGIFYRKKQERLVQVMGYYSIFRMKKISTKTWLQKNYELTDRWIEEDDSDPEPKLYRVHLLITDGRGNEAGWMLEKAKNTILQSRNLDDAVWCYYLYLSTLLKRDENYVNKIAQEVASAYEKNAGNWRLGWLLLYLSPEYSSSYSKKWLFIKQQFERGCKSPVFYIEALLLMRLEPSLFMELGDFEMQVLRYAARHGFLTDEIMMQLHYLVPRIREYSPGLLMILKKGYEEKKDSETLQNICTMLIRGNHRGKEDFPWYEAGVEENLRITNLYEYYMYSLDMSELKKLPKVIYMYFAYHNTLDWERSAFLYASLYQNRESLPDLYEKERFHIQEFVVKMIQEGRINEHLAFLYRQMLLSDVLLDEVREGLTPLLFSTKVKTTDLQMRRVILLYPGEIQEKSYILSEGSCVFPLYGEDYTLLLEDGTGGRYVSEERVEKECLFGEERAIPEAGSRDYTTLSLQLYLCGNHTENISEENIRRYERIFEDIGVSAEYKRRIVSGMAQFYYDSDQMEKLDDFLEKAEPAVLDSEKRGEVIRFLVIRDKLEKAAAWIKGYGMNGINPKTLMRLSSKMIQHMNRMEDETALSISYYAFAHGKYDLVTLEYLMEYYQGSTKALRDIWKTARDKGLDVHAFSERILMQMLYSGSYVGEKSNIFSAYMEKTMNLSLEKAFLTQCCYDYFVRERLTEAVVFHDLERLLRLGEQVHKVCLLAYTKYYAERSKERKDSRRKVLEGCLLKLLEEDVVLPYFAEYAEEFLFMRRFQDKTMIEYRTRPGRKVYIHYLIEQGKEEEEVYQTVAMKEVYEGVFSGMFVLFFGEKLFYYTTEEYEQDGEKQEDVTGSGSLSRNDIGGETQEGRFYMLNDIVIAEALQDYDTAGEILAEYERTDYLQKKMFTLK